MSKRIPRKRESFQLKNVAAAKKSLRNVPEIENETKGRTTYSITQKARIRIQAKARFLNCSASTLIEDLARDRYLLVRFADWLRLQKALHDQAPDIVHGLILSKEQSQDHQSPSSSSQ